MRGVTRKRPHLHKRVSLELFCDLELKKKKKQTQEIIDPRSGYVKLKRFEHHEQTQDSPFPTKVTQQGGVTVPPSSLLSCLCESGILSGIEETKQLIWDEYKRINSHENPGGFNLAHCTSVLIIQTCF